MGDEMRVLLAGLFVFGGLIVAVTVILTLFGDHVSPALMGLGMALWMLLLTVVALVLFNWGDDGIGRGGGDPRQSVCDLEAQGLLTSTDFKAVRAFQVEEWEDEGLHYFLELEDDSVLYVTGQDLYDYEAIEDDPELNQPRQFPCTEFTMRRHRENGCLVEMLCRGQTFEPEVVLPPFTGYDYTRGLVPEDGDIITDQTYDQIKQRLTSRGN